MKKLNEIKSNNINFIGFLTSVIATLGSLYFSIGLGLIPCRLCWYQRILMYPQALIFGSAILLGKNYYELTFPLSILGCIIAGYHSYLQIVGTESCGVFSCSIVKFKLFNILTIPNLSFIAFIILITTSVIGLYTGFSVK